MKAVKEHFKQKILDGKIEQNPFTHCFIEEIFPTKFYKDFISRIPYELFTGSLVKKQLGVHPNLGKFWAEFVEWMCSNEIQDLIVEKFKVKHGTPELIFYSDRKNYILGPHVDRKDKLFTSLFYLPKDDSQLHLGTALCVQDGPLKLFDWNSFRIAKKVDFKPNSFLCFTGPNSYHGVEKIMEDIERISLQYLIRD